MQLVRLEVNPEYKPATPEEKATFDAIKKDRGGLAIRRGPIPYVTALENIKYGRGMFRIAEGEPKTGGTVATSLEDMPTEQLKIMMLTSGVTPTKKQMSRDEVIQTIRTKLAALEISEDTDAEG